MDKKNQKITVDGQGNVLTDQERPIPSETEPPVQAPSESRPLPEKHEDYFYWCRFCHAGFAKSWQLRNHEPECAIAHGWKKCHRCNEVFSTAEEALPNNHECSTY
jgi:hypothetical protein